MPVVIRLFGYKIYFWTNEGKPLEPLHVHIAKKPHQNATKVWILSSGKTKIDNNNSGIPHKDLSRICETPASMLNTYISECDTKQPLFQGRCNKWIASA